jgi:hypothetical protein
MPNDKTDLPNLIMATGLLTELKKRPDFQPADHGKCVEICARVFGLTVEQVEFAFKETS